jgi:gliding motility-associated-like protein
MRERLIYLVCIFLAFVLNNESHAQTAVYQDIFKGGVTGDAFNPWMSTIDGEFEIHIEPGSTIRKAYLFVNVYNSPSEKDLIFNGTPIVLNQQNTCNNDYFHISNNNIRRIRTLIIDVTNLINPLENSYTISPPANQPIYLSEGIYTDYYLYVTYENPLLEEICANAFINNIQPQMLMEYPFNSLNTMDINQNVGLAIHSSAFCDTIQDGSFVFVNGTQIGLIGGQDDHSSEYCTGVVGTFYYQNAIFQGLGNDIANETMNGADAIVNIESYLASTTSFNLTFNYQSNLGPQTNPIHQLFLTYSTSCHSFDVNNTSDTTICPNSPLQLSASGGTRYEWQPATGLSCTDCPNPIATLDSSQLYTVRIWNNDSCSVVRPVKVNVRELPTFQSINPTATVCGTETGSVLAVAQNTTALPVSYSLNGGVFQPSTTFTGQFSNLEAGSYTLSLQDAFGCQRDTVFSIASSNSTQALFTASPQSGAAPLTVSFTNTSVNATDFEWFINGESQGASLSTFTFDTSGVYTVTLVAWQNSPACADTFSLQISVFDTLILQIPNIFTPNNDGVNDFYSITSNLAVNYECIIFNRWGNVVASKKNTFTPGIPELIWDGKDATDGTYFYMLEVEVGNEVKKFEGFLVRVGE